MIRAVALGSDHAAFAAKTRVMNWLKQQGVDVKDYGCESEASVDYPDFAVEVAQAVRRGEVQAGVLLCGTGIGMSMTANKVHGVRAALCHNVFTATMARKHNDANVLCLGARVHAMEDIQAMVQAFLSASFERGRHQRRVDKIHAMERHAAQE